MTTNTNAASVPGPEDQKFNAWYESKFKPAMERGPLDKYVARQAWFAALSTAAQPPAVVGEKFQRAWIQLNELPGGMMVGPNGRFGPIPGSTSAWITTSERERDRILAEGTTMLEVWLAAAPKAESEPVISTVDSLRFNLECAKNTIKQLEEENRELRASTEAHLDFGLATNAEPVQQPSNLNLELWGFVPAQQPERVPLTEQQISDAYFEALGSQHLREQDRKMVTRFTRAIEAAHGIQPAHKEQPDD